MMRICFVEDDAVAGLEPLTLSRPTFGLRLGGGTLGSKIVLAFAGTGQADLGSVIRPHLAPTVRQRAPDLAVNDGEWLSRGPVLVANARWVPPTAALKPDLDARFVGYCDGRPACALVGPDEAEGLERAGWDRWIEEILGAARGTDIGGEWIDRPWDLVAKNADHIARDFDSEGKVGLNNRHLSSIALVGPADRIFIHETARVDPYTVFDTTNGPITVEAGAVVQPFTRVEGPCYIGKDTQLFRANLRGGVTLGPNCRIGGEVEASIVHGYSNKYHEGFLGHSYIGEWVNLGAITSNSDLRNDYGEVHVPIAGDPVATGQAKVGCFLGDHTRTGLGSMLNTGTAVGVMCNVLPAGLLLPKHVPSFTAVLYGRVAPGFSLDQLFATARTVKERRGQEFTAAEEDLYRTLFEQTRFERQNALPERHEPRIADWAGAARDR